MLKQLDSAGQRKGCRVIGKIRVRARVRARVRGLGLAIFFAPKLEGNKVHSKEGTCILILIAETTGFCNRKKRMQGHRKN